MKKLKYDELLILEGIFEIAYEGTNWKCEMEIKHAPVYKKLFPKDYNSKTNLLNFATLKSSDYKNEYINFLARQAKYYQDKIESILLSIKDLTGRI